MSIYKLIDNTNGAVYIGSTKQRLCDRIGKHRRDFKLLMDGKDINVCSSTAIIANGNFTITLLEKCTPENILIRERFYIETMECINKRIPTRTEKERYKEDPKPFKDKVQRYREKHANEIKEKLSSKVTCECGSIVSTSGLYVHKKSKKHIKLCVSLTATLY